MKNPGTLLLWACTFAIVSCNSDRNVLQNHNSDSLAIVSMIESREQAMISKDIRTALSQFGNDATWINSQGYFFKGKQEVAKFHNMLAGRDSLDYYYEAGEPRITIVDQNFALAYYSWKMFWFRKGNPSDTTFREIGLMSLTARKQSGSWKWIAVTNQHTPWFYPRIEAVTVD